MAVNLKLQLLRGLLENLPATTGLPGVLAWTTDSNELFVDTGAAFQRLAAGNQVFNVTSLAQLTGLAAMIGDIAVLYTGSPASYVATYVLTAFPAGSAGNWKLVATSTGGIQSLANATAHEFVTYVDAAGVQHLAQPTFADIAGTLSAAQLPATIDCGTF
jgi:hypothetical protein